MDQRKFQNFLGRSGKVPKFAQWIRESFQIFLCGLGKVPKFSSLDHGKFQNFPLQNGGCVYSPRASPRPPWPWPPPAPPGYAACCLTRPSSSSQSDKRSTFVIRTLVGKNGKLGLRKSKRWMLQPKTKLTLGTKLCYWSTLSCVFFLQRSVSNHAHWNERLARCELDSPKGMITMLRNTIFKI